VLLLSMMFLIMSVCSVLGMFMCMFVKSKEQSLVFLFM
jgi:hypothetical protein